jgi:hypothetical protein
MLGASEIGKDGISSAWASDEVEAILVCRQPSQLTVMHTIESGCLIFAAAGKGYLMPCGLTKK